MQCILFGDRRLDRDLGSSEPEHHRRRFCPRCTLTYLNVNPLNRRSYAYIAYIAYISYIGYIGHVDVFCPRCTFTYLNVNPLNCRRPFVRL